MICWHLIARCIYQSHSRCDRGFATRFRRRWCWFGCIGIIETGMLFHLFCKTQSVDHTTLLFWIVRFDTWTTYCSHISMLTKSISFQFVANTTLEGKFGGLWEQRASAASWVILLYPNWRLVYAMSHLHHLAWHLICWLKDSTLNFNWLFARDGRQDYPTNKLQVFHGNQNLNLSRQSQQNHYLAMESIRPDQYNHHKSNKNNMVKEKHQSIHNSHIHHQMLKQEQQNF